MATAKKVRALGALVLLIAAAAPAIADAVRPQRIVSLNLCADQILLDLVGRERIAGLSFLATDPTMSADTDAARGIPAVRGEAEEVLALKPDIVLAGAYSTPATRSLLERLGVPLVAVPMASSFAEIRDTIRFVARAVGETARGEDLVQSLDKRLSAARAAGGTNRPTAVAYQVNSLASGPGSLMDEMLIAAGYRNLAADRTLGPGGRLPLETLVVAPPDLLVFANAPDDFRTVLGDNLRHPALAKMLETRRSLHISMPLWLCGTQHTVRAVELLAAARVMAPVASLRKPGP